MSDKRFEVAIRHANYARLRIEEGDVPRAVRQLVDTAQSLLASLSPADEAGGVTPDQLWTLNDHLHAKVNDLTTQLAAVTAERDALKLAKNDDFGITISNFMRDALVALAGAVCTPERGYLVDGGLRQMLLDIQTLRKQHDDLLGLAVRVKEVFGPMYEQGQCGQTFELLYARAKKLTSAALSASEESA